MRKKDSTETTVYVPCGDDQFIRFTFEKITLVHEFDIHPPPPEQVRSIARMTEALQAARIIHKGLPELPDK